VVEHSPYEKGTIDLAFFIITALTIYMAVKSRRFMPIAGIAACSLIAVFITQIIFTINSTINYNKLQRKLVSAIPYKLEFFLAIVGTCVVLLFGTFWAWKFKVVYLDPWPTDSEFTSVFMRMTASDRKPFHAGDFIRENNLQGKMFNYWTEGGFIGWCQNPDPNTGKTPLRLFMDGRAQAAYDPKTYRLWSQIMAGGPTAYSISLAGRKHTQSDYKEMGKYISEVLRKRKVWLILMPINKNTNHFIKSIETNNNWPSLFFNNKQRIYVDRESKIGRKLFEGIVTGDTVYPNKFSRNLMLARIYAKQKSIESKKLGFKMALEAFELLPSQVPLLEIVSYARYTELKPQVDDFCKKYIQDIKENINQYRNEDSYFNRITSTLLAIRYLERAIGSKEDPQFVSLLANTKKAFESERRQTTKLKKW
jgi:hypothetical protein